MAAYRRFMTHVTCRLTAKNRDQLRNPTLGNRVGSTFTFLTCSYNQVSVAEWLARLTVVWEDPGSNHTADGCVYYDGRCDIQPWARAAHLYWGAMIDSAFHPPWDGKMGISLRDE